MEILEESQRREGQEQGRDEDRLAPGSGPQYSSPRIGDGCHPHEKQRMSRTPMDVQGIADQQQVDVAPSAMLLRNGIIEQEQQRVDQYEIE